MYIYPDLRFLKLRDALVGVEYVNFDVGLAPQSVNSRTRFT
jgi:hypothetical protein